MKKEVVEKMFKEKGNVYIPQRKKIWFSISKFEKYPEMAAEGVGRAIGYLALLMFLFAIILAVGFTINLNLLIDEFDEYIDENISVIDYKDGNLNVELSTLENKFITDSGTVIIDTSDVNNDTMAEYESTISSNDLGIIWLKNYVTVKVNGEQQNFYYENIFSDLGINEFDKSDLLGFFENTLKSPTTYISYFVLILLYTFTVYFIASLINILLLSIFGVLTALIAKMKMRYRAVFNMSVYAITISTILQLIYLMINLFTSFEIKYFDLMYSAISYICLTAAIFMIKSDVIKQQIEMIKIAKEKQDEKKQDDEEKQEDKDKEDDTSKEENSNDNEDKKDKKEEKKEDEGIGNNDVEGQGSNA